jgi:hypothetical protein
MGAIARVGVFVKCGRGKAQEFFFETDPLPVCKPSGKGGPVIKDGKKNFLLKSLGSLFAKPYQRVLGR